jgi:hypothetical protein
MNHRGRTARSARAALLGTVLVVLCACGGPGARAPQTARGDLTRLFDAGFRLDATGDAQAATKAYLDVVRAAAP